MSLGILAGNIAAINLVSATVDLGSVAANTTEEEEITLTGVKTGDFVVAVKPSLEAGLSLGSCRVSAADTLQLTVCNPTGGAIDTASEASWLFLVVSPEGNFTTAYFPSRDINCA